MVINLKQQDVVLEKFKMIKKKILKQRGKRRYNQLLFNY